MVEIDSSTLSTVDGTHQLVDWLIVFHGSKSGSSQQIDFYGELNVRLVSLEAVTKIDIPICSSSCLFMLGLYFVVNAQPSKLQVSPTGEVSHSLSFSTGPGGGPPSNTFFLVLLAERKTNKRISQIFIGAIQINSKLHLPFGTQSSLRFQWRHQCSITERGQCNGSVLSKLLFDFSVCLSKYETGE